MRKCILEQSFWFDGLDFDNNDYPIETPSFIDNIDYQSYLLDDYNLFDQAYGTNRFINFSELLSASNKIKWELIKEKTRHCMSVTIVNDIPFQNEELAFIKKFYLMVFYSALKKENINCYIYNAVA